MPIRKSKRNPTERLQRKRLTVSVIVACGIGVAVIFVSTVIAIVPRLVGDIRMVEISPLRQQIIQAAEGSAGVAAPVDPKTGDIYFPKSRLFVPNPPLASLTYAVSNENTDEQVLFVSDRGTVGAYAGRLYNAKNMIELFALVPKLQACQRGVSIVYKNKSMVDGAVLKATAQLNNGRTIYLFYDDRCPELSNIASLLKKLQAY